MKETENNKEMPNNGPLITRRMFFEYMAIHGISLASGKVLSDRTLGIISQENKEQGKNNNSFATTVKETVLFNFAQFGTFPIINGLGIKIGNAGVQQELDDMESDQKYTRRELLESFILFGTDVFIGGPIREEFIFRSIPSTVTAEKGNPKWGIGALSSAVFALSHNVVTDKTTDRYKFDLKTIPLYQFTEGLFFWKMIVERGYGHAVLSHSTVNASAVPVTIFVEAIAEAAKFLVKKTKVKLHKLL